MSTGIEAIRNDADYVCKSCIFGRQSVKPYNYYLPRGRYKIDVLYVNVVYLPIESFDSCRYFISIIDNQSQQSVTKPIQRRSDAPLVVQEFITYNSTPKCYTTLIIQDRGGKNISDSYKLQIRNRGIAIYLSSTEQYEQNGAAEAYNKAIEHKTQSTINYASPDLDPRYQSLVIEYGITYLRNRLLCRRLLVTLYEAQTGNKLYLSNIRIIGYKAYVYKLTAEIDKLIGSKANVQRLLRFKGNG